MKTSMLLLVGGMIAGIFASTHAQVFQNLGFESPAEPTGGGQFGLPFYSITNWTVSYNGVAQTGVSSNDFSLNNTTVALINHTSQAVFHAIDGSQSLFLSASTAQAVFEGFSVAEISQTGAVSASANSIQFLLGAISGSGLGVDTNFPASYFFVTMNGQNVPLQELGTSGSNLILGGNISAWAGQTAQLSIGVQVPYSFPVQEVFSGVIDDVSFSAAVVPEPSTLVLATAGGVAVLLLFRRRYFGGV